MSAVVISSNTLLKSKYKVENGQDLQLSEDVELPESKNCHAPTHGQCLALWKALKWLAPKALSLSSSCDQGA